MLWCTMPSNWPELTLAVALALAGADLLADLVARFVQSTLRAVIADPAVETAFVDRPRRIIRVVTFLVATVALIFPAMRLAGYHTALGSNPQAIATWLLDIGLRIIVIAIAAWYYVGRDDSTRDVSLGGNPAAISDARAASPTGAASDRARSRNARQATVISHALASVGGSSRHAETLRMSASCTASSAVAKSAPRRTRTFST